MFWYSLAVGGLQPHYIDWISGYTLLTVLQQLLDGFQVHYFDLVSSVGR
jgi:hypothetical protein